MSTKSSLKYERDEATGQRVHLYQDADEEHVYLEPEGFPFEAASSVTLSGRGWRASPSGFPMLGPTSLVC